MASQLPTLEQQRAQDTWEKSRGCSDKYRNLAKSMPALIINSGLMQVLAFLQDKAKKGSDEEKLSRDLYHWLAQRFKTEIPQAEFNTVMNALMHASPSFYQQVNKETFAWLRWMRQMAAAQGDAKNTDHHSDR